MKYLLFLLCLVNFAIGQISLSTLFKNDIDSTAAKNKNRVARILNDVESIHPELIPYAIEEINDNPAKDRLSLKFKEFRAYYAKQKNSWLQTQIQYANRTDFPESLKKEAENLLMESWIKDINMFRTYRKPEGDSVTRLKILYKYFTGNSDPGNLSTNELEQRIKTEKEKRGKIIDKIYSPPGGLESFEKTALNRLIQYWYLCHEDLVSKPSENMPALYILNSKMNEIAPEDNEGESLSSVRPWTPFGIEIGYSFLESTPVSYTIETNFLDTTATFSEDLPYNTINIGANYFINLRDEPGVMKYIRFSAVFGFGSGGSHTGSIDEIRNEYSVGEIDYVEILRVQEMTQTIKSAQRFSLTMTIPVFYIFSSLPIEILGGMDFSQITVENTYQSSFARESYRDGLLLSRPSGFRYGTEETEIKSDVFNGGIVLRYLGSSGLNWGASLTLNYVSVFFGVVI